MDPLLAQNPLLKIKAGIEKLEGKFHERARRLSQYSLRSRKSSILDLISNQDPSHPTGVVTQSQQRLPGSIRESNRSAVNISVPSSHTGSRNLCETPGKIFLMSQDLQTSEAQIDPKLRMRKIGGKKWKTENKNKQTQLKIIDGVRKHEEKQHLKERYRRLQKLVSHKVQRDENAKFEGKDNPITFRDVSQINYRPIND